MNALKPHPQLGAPKAMAKHELNFLEFLQTFRRGDLLHDGDQKLTELMEAIRETGGNGSMTLKLSFKTNKAGQLEVQPDLTVKKPARPLGMGVYFVTDDARLTRRDPNQMDIEDEIERRRGLDN